MGGGSSLKIETKSDGDLTIVWVIGRIRSEDLKELQRQVNINSERVILDLGEVTVVDAAVVRFLSASEQAGITLAHCPAYVREWILRERAEG